MRIFKEIFGDTGFEVIRLKILKNSLLFLIGGGAYVGLELAWRGRSHISMFAAGGVCFLLIGKLNRVRPRLPLLWRALTGAGIITMVELAAGLIANRDYRVWDYRRMPGNFLGQICPAFTALWVPVALLALGLHGWLDNRLDKALRR